METFAVSIESDSLNRDDKKNDGTCIRKNMKRTKSVDDLSTSVNCVKGKVRQNSVKSRLDLIQFHVHRIGIPMIIHKRKGRWTATDSKE